MKKQKKIKKAKTPFRIQDGDIVFLDEKFKEKITLLKATNEGAWGEASIEIIDKIQYFQHKYYRSNLLPEISMTEVQCDHRYKMHILLKEKFLGRDISSWKEIPERHMKRGVAIVSELYDHHGLAVKIPSGRCIILIDEKEKIIAYIPSMATLTFDEAKDFLLQCEDLQSELIGTANMTDEDLKVRVIALGLDL